MSIKFKCGGCQARQVIDDTMAGQKLACPGCGQWLRVPGPRVDRPTAPAPAATPPFDIYGLNETEDYAPRPAAPAPSVSIPDEEKVPSRAAYGPLSDARKKQIAKRAIKNDRDKPSYAGAGMTMSFGAVLAIALFGWRMYRNVNRVAHAVNAPAAAGGVTPITEAQAAAESDREVVEMLKRPGSAEAREWLEVPNHAVAEMSKEQARSFVEGFYERGALKVSVLDPEKFGERVVAAFIAVELPRDPVARRKCFEWEIQHTEEEPTEDTGQRFIQILTD